MASHDNAGRVERDLLAIKQGIAQVLTSGKTISFEGTSYDQASFEQFVDAVLAPFSNVRRLKALIEEGMVERRAKKSEAERIVNVIKHAAGGTFGEKSVEFAAFGFAPKKKAVPLTPEQKQHKLEQLRATRLARHTMGKRQKQAVKGDVSSNGGNAGSPATPPTGRTS